MDQSAKPFVHISINAVHAVVLDLTGRYDADRHDRYPTFTEARDAALCCNEAMLDETDYDDESHKQELEWIIRLLEPAGSLADLETHPDYLGFVSRLEPAQFAAA